MRIDITQDQLDTIQNCFITKIERLELQRRDKIDEAQKATNAAAREFFAKQAAGLEKIIKTYKDTREELTREFYQGSTYKDIKRELENIRERLNKDTAGFASTMLQRERANLDFLTEYKHRLFCSDRLTPDENDNLAFEIRELKTTVRKLLNDRIKWQAQGIERTIEARKNAGTYKGEFTTAVILANAYNDIFKNDYDYNFDGGAGT